MCRMVILLVLASLAAASTIRRHHPHYLECMSGADCSGYECCVFLSKGLYSIPRCMNRGGPWASCDSKHSVRGENRSVTYLDGATVDFSNIYYQLCPCELGLECDRKSNTCLDPVDGEDFNNLQMK